MRVIPYTRFTFPNKIFLVLICCLFFLKTNTLQSQCQVSNAGPSQTLCIGTNALMAANTATGAGIGRWTLVSGSGVITNSLIPNTTITGLPVGTNVFAWTITNGTCTPSSSNVTITTRPLPTPANAGPSQTVCVTAGSALLAGNNPVNGIGRWIKVSGPGVITNSLLPNSTITGLTVGTTVLTWSISNSPCTSSTANMTITTRPAPSVSNAGTSKTICATGSSTVMNATAPAIGTGVWVRASGSGTCTTPNSPTSNVTGLAVGNSVYTWSVSNPPCASSVSSITITVRPIPSIAAAGPDQTVCVSSGAVMAANTPTAGTGLWTLLGGAGTITTPTSPTSGITGLGVGSNTFRWTISNAPCASTQDNIIIVGRAVPSIANAGVDQTVCVSTGSTTLAGNTPTAGIGRWVKVSGPGTITNSLTPNSTLTGLTVGTTVLTWSISNLPCTTSVDNVTITTRPLPSIAAAGVDQTVCVSSSATMAANTPTAGTGLWTLIGGSGTITTPTSPVTTITGLGVGNNTFRWTISNAPCTATFDDIIIVGRAVPSIANAGVDQTVCVSTGSTTLAGNTPTAGVGAWVKVSGPGTITNSLSPTSTLTGLTVGTTVLTWSISNLPCTTSVDNVTITIRPLPSIAAAGGDQTVCVSSNATMAANTPTAGIGVWTLIGGAGTITTPNSPVTTITSLGVGNNTFRWTISNAPCTATFDDIIIVGRALPSISNAGTNQTICISTPTTVMTANTATVGTGAWTLVSGGGTITNSLSPTTSITGLPLGNNVFAWTIANAPCLASSTNVTITVNDIPTTANAGISQTLCISSPTTVMSANTATVGIGTWSLVSGTGVITNSLSPTTSITGLAVGTNVFAWTIVNLPCSPSTSTVAIVIKDVVTVSNAGTNQSLCISTPTTVMTANTATVGIGAWTLVSGGGTITNSLSPTTSITGLPLGNNVFAWTIANAPCPPSSSNVTITVNDVPTTANAGISQTLCISSPTTVMNANTATVGIGTWSLVSGTGVITNSLSPTTSITGLAVGTNIFAWTINDLPCSPSTSTVAIEVKDVVTVSNAGSNQSLCISTPTTVMTANTATVGIGAWTLVSGGGTITNSLSPTTSITGLPLGNNVFAWTITNAPCAPSSSNVTITVNDVPTTANAGASQTLCISSPSTTMNGNFPIVGIGTWSLVSGTGVITNSLLPNTTVTGLGLGNNVFEWIITDAPCAPSISNVTLTVNQAPTTANAGSNQTLCISNPNTFMTANTATVGTGAWTLVSGTGVITNSLSPTTSITGLGLGNNVFAWTIANAPCSPSSSNVTITVNQVPTTSNAGTNQSLCISSPIATMNGNFPAVGTGTWTLVSGTGVITNSLSPTTSITGLGLGNNVFAWTISNAPCVNSSSNVTLTVNQVPTTASAGSNQTLCITSPNTFMTANTATVGTGAWTLVSGGGTITNSLSPSTSITGLPLGNNVFAWTIANAPCAPSVSNITITVNQVPSTSIAGASQTLCISSPVTTMNGNFPAVGIGSWSLVSGTGVITNSLLPTTSITGLAVGINVFAWTIANAPCLASSSTVAIVVSDIPTVSNAGTSQTLCISSPNTFMTANTATVGTGAWTLVSGGGTITNSLSPSTSITGLPLGTNVFAWTISNAPCSPSSSTVAIIVRDIPTTSNAGTSQTLCISSPTTTMNANSPGVGTGAWTLVSGTGVITNSLSATTSITGLGLGVNVFAWTISNNPCTPSSSNVTITVNQVPTLASAGSNQTLCITSPNTFMTANTATVGTGAWTLVSGTGVITNSLSPTTSITGLGLGNNVFAWTISNAPCAPSISNVTITVRQVPNLSSAGSPQTLCISSPTTVMNANSPGVGTGAWTLVSGGGTITNSLSPTTSITGLPLGNNVFAWTISNNPCTPSSSNVTITVNQVPTLASAGSNQTLCITSPNTFMTANTATVGTGAWTLVSGTGVITNSLSPTTSITGLGLGNNVFAWTISNAPCAPSISNVTITVRQVPNLSSAGSPQTLCISSPTTTMNANTPGVGTGAWTLVSGTGVITNSLSATTSITGLGLGINVFAWTISNNPCTPSTSNVTITVNQVPTASNAGTTQTLCISSPNTFMTANTATVGTGAWTLVSGGGTITNSLSPSTSITGLPLGTNVFAWTISNAPCSPSSSTVAIIVRDIPTTSNAGTSQTLCISSPTTVMNANTPGVGTGAWTLVSGGGTITNSLSPTTSITGLPLGNNVFSWTIANAPCAPSVSNVTITVNQAPTTSNAGTTQTLCISSPATLMNANTPGIGTGAWTLVSGGGTITNSLSPSTSITGLPLGTNVFAWTISNAPCSPSSSTVALIVNDLPTASNAGVNQTVCFNVPTATMTANAPVIGTGAWTLVSGTGIISNSLSPTSAISGLAIGTNVFAWTITNAPCAPSVSTMTILVNPGPTIANAGTTQTLCISNPNALMNGNVATSGTGVWTIVSGTGVITNSLSPTTSITGLGLGTNIFAWTIYDNPCFPSTSTVALIVNDVPTVANAGISQTLCISSPTTVMTANTATVGVGVWTLVSGGGTITNSLSPTTSITGLPLGTNVFQWTISNAPCLASSSTMTIEVKDIPTVANAGTTQTLCISNPNALMSANTPTVGTGVWTLVSGSGTITNSLSPTTSITGLGLGTNIFQWTIGNVPCSPTSSTVALIVNDVPTISNAGASQTICISSPSTVMNANFPSVGVGAWTLVSGTGVITNSLLPTTTITGLALGTNVFQWTISNAPCLASSSTMTIEVKDIPTVANAGTTQTLCITNPNALMSANTPTVGTGLWTLVLGSGTITNPTSPNTTITGLGLGTNIFQWTIGNVPCSPSSSTVALIVNDVPTVSNAGASQTICISSPSTVMNANFPSVGVGAWTLVSGTGVITNSLLPTTTITGLALGTNVFQWTISNAPCLASSSTMTIEVKDVPTVSNAGTTQTLCITNPNAVMSANTPTVGTGLWTLVLGSGTISNPTSPNTTITGLGLGTNIFQWTIGNVPCSPTSSTVALIVNDVPTVSNAGASQTICISSPSTVMNANFPSVGVGAWTLVSGTGVITNSLLPTTTITGLALGTNVFQWTISNAPCLASSSTMTIEVKDVPTVANAGTTQTLCITNPNALMSANTPTVGTGLWTLVLGSGTISNPTSPNTTITGLGLGTNIFQWTIGNVPCSPSSSTVALIVNDVPTVSNAGASQTICISSPTTVMTANTATVGTGVWTLVSGGGTITNSLSPTTSITGLPLGTNVFEWTISNAPCLASSSTMTIEVKDVPTVANAGFSQTVCITSPNAFMNANAATVGVGTWSLISGSGTITNSLSPSTSITGLGLGLNIFEWTISNNPCAASSSTVSILVNDIPSVSNAGTTQTLCISSPTTTMTANTPTIGTGMWTLVSGSGAITSPTSPNTTITGLGLGNNVFAWTISNMPCLSSVSNVTLVVNDVPTVSNAGITQTLCISSPTTVMTANTATVGVGTWSLVSGSGTITNSLSPTTSITGLGLGANVFEWTISKAPCLASVSSVTLYVDDVPTISTVGPAQNLCAASSTLSGNAPTVGTGLWTVIAGGSSVTTPTLNNSLVTSLLTGTNTLVWTISNGVCASSSSTLDIFVNPFPSPAVAGADQTVCSPNATLNAVNPAIGFGTWSILTGTSSVTSPTIGMSGVTGLSNGANTFVWTTSYGTCPNNSDTVTIFRDSLPTISVAGANQTLCLPTTTLNANIPIVGIGTWSVISGGSSVTTPTLNSSGVTSLATGNNIFEWSIVNGVCPASTSTVSVFVDSYPTPSNAGTDFTICASTSTLNSNIPTIGTGIWSVIIGGSSVTTPTLNASQVTGLANGINSFVWTTLNGTCPSSTSTVTIFRDSLPTISVAGANQTLCLPTTTLNANTPLVGIGTWSVISGGSSVTTPTLNTSGVTSLATGNNIFEWSIVNGVCPASTSTVSVFVDSYPTPSNAGTDFTICASTSTLNSNIPTIGTGVWSVIIGGSSVTTPTLNASQVTGLATGINSLVWTTSNGTCPSSTSTVNIQVDDFASPVSAGPDQAFCLTATSTILNATNPTVGAGTWSVMAGAGTFANANSNTTSVSGLVTGTNTLVWTNTNGVCPTTSDTVDIVLLMFPTVANAGPDQVLCPNSTILAGNLPSIGIGNWSVVTGAGSVNTPTLNTSNVNALSTGTNSLVWTTSNGNCPISTDTVILIVLPPVQQADAGADTTIYVTSAPVNGNIPTSGTGAWQFVGGSYNITNPNQSSTILTNLVPGVNTIKWVITEMCGSTEDEKNITLIILPIPNAISPNGDGDNDFLEVPIADFYKQVELKVVNRWGSLVYENNDYKNTWNGVNQDNQPLAEDTYFYVIKLDGQVYTGYILIKR